MDVIMQLVDFILNIDQHLAVFLQDYGMWIYGILFLIIFVETGFVVMPFLPGDSLLFAAGALAAFTGALNPALLIALLFLAAVLGDTLITILVNISDLRCLLQIRAGSIIST